MNTILVDYEYLNPFVLWQLQKGSDKWIAWKTEAHKFIHLKYSSTTFTHQHYMLIQSPIHISYPTLQL